MRAAEAALAGSFAVFTLAALVMRLPGPRRTRALALGICGLLIVASLPRIGGLSGGRLVRDFIPGLLILMSYWQSGQFVLSHDPRFQEFLVRFDQRWFPRTIALRDSIDDRGSLSRYLHASYLGCYPMVPLGVAVLYAAGRPDVVPTYWLVVLVPTLICQALTTVCRSWPPWMSASADPTPSAPSAVQGLNTWLIEHASIRANTFPSGHVASTTAIALVIAGVAPLWGLVFLWLAGSVAAATVLLRYHYTLDVFLGLALAVVSYGIFG